MDDTRDRGVSSMPPVKRSVSLSHLSTPLIHKHSKGFFYTQASVSAEDAFRSTTPIHSFQHRYKIHSIQAFKGKHNCLLTDSNRISYARSFSVSSSQLNMENIRESESSDEAALKEIASTDFKKCHIENIKKFEKRCQRKSNFEKFRQNLKTINLVTESSTEVCNGAAAEITSSDFMRLQETIISDTASAQKISVAPTGNYSDKAFKTENPETNLYICKLQQSHEKTGVHRSVPGIKAKAPQDTKTSENIGKNGTYNTSPCKLKPNAPAKHNKLTASCNEISVTNNHVHFGHLEHKQSGKYQMRNEEPTCKRDDKASGQGHAMTNATISHKPVLVELESRHNIESDAFLSTGKRSHVDRRLSEDVEWIRTSSMDNLQLQNAANTNVEISIIRARVPSQFSRCQQKNLMFIILFGLILNPIIAPAGIYCLLQSKKAWSQGHYHTAYRLNYQAGGIALIGIIGTITLLISLILTVPKNQNVISDSTVITVIPTTTSSENQDVKDIQAAGERLYKTLIDRSSSRSWNGKYTTQSRNSRRPTNSMYNTNIEHLKKLMEEMTPVETTDIASVNNLSDLMNPHVSTSEIRRMFSNKTMSVYFDPASNRTRIVQIPVELQ